MASRRERSVVRKQIQQDGGWEGIRERICSGENDSQIARTLLRTDGRPISRNFFNQLLHEVFPQVEIDAMRREYAHARADHAAQVAEACPVDRDAVQKAKLVIDTDFRLAQAFDREQFGEKGTTVNVEVNQGILHLDALRRRAVMGGNAAPQTARATGAHVRETVSTVTTPLSLQIASGDDSK